MAAKEQKVRYLHKGKTLGRLCHMSMQAVHYTGMPDQRGR